MALESRRPSTDRPRRPLLVRILRTIFFALFFAFLFGFVVGTILRRELDRPVRYMGEIPSDAANSSFAFRSLVGSTDPGNIRYSLTRVLVSRHDEEQIG